MDMQNRIGSKVGSGGQLSSSQQAANQRERLRKLALETIDLSKDPYFMRTNVGTFECKLCLTVHPNEGNYMAHTQGKRHQNNVGRRAALAAKKEAEQGVMEMYGGDSMKREAMLKAKKKSMIRIGKPGYKVTKTRDLVTERRSLTFELDYPDANKDTRPRYRFLSAYEQNVEFPDTKFQYLVFACDPYENVAFKIPNEPINKEAGQVYFDFDEASKKRTLQFSYLN
jgi:splicing factor 3A subunit 2